MSPKEAKSNTGEGPEKRTEGRWVFPVVYSVSPLVAWFPCHLYSFLAIYLIFLVAAQFPYCWLLGMANNVGMPRQRRVRRHMEREQQEKSIPDLPQSISALGVVHSAANLYMPAKCPFFIYTMSSRTGLPEALVVDHIRSSYYSLGGEVVFIYEHFHLTIGEMIVTLQDLQVLLGIRVDCPVVVGLIIVSTILHWESWLDCYNELLNGHSDPDVVYHDPRDDDMQASFKMGTSLMDLLLQLHKLHWTYYRNSYDDMNSAMFVQYMRPNNIYMIGSGGFQQGVNRQCSICSSLQRAISVYEAYMCIHCRMSSTSTGLILTAPTQRLTFSKLLLSCKWSEDSIYEILADNTMAYRDGLRESQVIDEIVKLSNRVERSVYINCSAFDTHEDQTTHTQRTQRDINRPQGSRRSTSDAPTNLVEDHTQRSALQAPRRSTDVSLHTDDVKPPRHSMYVGSDAYGMPSTFDFGEPPMA
ncbi:hypothetical protein M5K25_007043 [Dendrobium thyrsiflorum]|uniref:Uncharacterized protein n=1 Tax=Dendrobium thyrsiflorum TaxID=117978 RepID=A0ABD0VKE7_DENTH